MGGGSFALMRAYWYVGEGGRNLGDALTPVLFARRGIALPWVPAADADFFGIGSNLGLVPAGYRGIIWGTGIGRARSQGLQTAEVYALRGRLSVEESGVEPPLLADPGLLAIDLLPERPAVEFAEGTIPHFSDHRLLDRKQHYIDILGPVTQTIAEIARCHRITSSSLHGLVVADALGIENRWWPHPTQMPAKYADYVSAYGKEIIPGHWRLAPQDLVAEKQAALRKQLDELILR